MKVKKKYLILISIIILLFSLLIMGAGLIIVSKQNIRFADGMTYVKNGFTTNPASNNIIKKHNNLNQNNYDIIHYEINIDLDTENEEIKGSTEITAVSLSELKNIILNFNDSFEINAVLINGVVARYNYDDDFININISNNKLDTLNIKIDYEGTPESLGFGSFVFGEFNDKSVVYTLNEPIFAFTWFPCIDLPSDKALMDIYITNDIEKTSVSNGVLKDIIIENGRKTFHWQTIYPISTYLISIYSANYSHFSDTYVTSENDTMNIDYYVFKEDYENAKRDFKIHKNAMKYLSELFGEYPFIKEKYGVAEFLWSFGAMEHQTITGIGQRFVSGHQFYTGMLVHELAHQWWGNAVTLSDWKNIWLNEGFATYSEALYWEKEGGPLALKSTMRSYLTDFSGTTLYNPEKLFSRVIYNKGAWVLHMLRKELGDAKFFNLLRNYYKNYKYRNASVYNFIELVELESNRKFDKFFEQWVFTGEGKIELIYEENKLVKDETTIVELTINQIQKSYASYEFLLDIEFLLDDGSKIIETVRIDKKSFYFTKSFCNKIIDITLDPNGWLAADIIEKESH